MIRFGAAMKARIEKRLTERAARKHHEIKKGLDQVADELHPAEVRLVEAEIAHADHDDPTDHEGCSMCDAIWEDHEGCHEDHPDFSGGCPLCPTPC